MWSKYGVVGGETRMGGWRARFKFKMASKKVKNSEEKYGQQMRKKY